VSQERNLFVESTYNRSGNGADLAVVAFPGIDNLHALNTLNSSTPAASTNIDIFVR
jgi:hypothetical protein